MALARRAVAVVGVLLAFSTAVVAQPEIDRSQLGWEQDADRIGAAQAEGEEALDAALATTSADRWLVVDALVRREAWDLAARFAAADGAPAFEGMPAYVAAQRATPVDPAVRDLRDRAVLALRAQDAATALELLAQAPAEGGGVPAAYMHYMRGMVLLSMQRVPEALVPLRAGGEVAERIGWISIAHECFRRAGGVAMAMQEYEAAGEVLRRQYPLALRVAAPEDLAACVINVGGAAAGRKDFEEAVVWLRRGLDVTLPAVGGDPEVIRNYRLNDLMMLSQIHEIRGEYAHVVGVLEEAPALAASLGRDAHGAMLLLRLAVAQLQLELTEDAAASYAAALAAFERLDDPDRCRAAMRGLGAAYVDLGRYDEAVATYEHLATLPGADRESAVTRAVDRGEYGTALQSAGRTEDAEAAYAEGLALAEAGGAEDTASWLRLQRATLLVEQGRHDEARPLIEAAVAWAHDHDDAYTERHALLWLTRVHLARGETAEAIASANRGLERATSLLAGLADENAARARTSVTALTQVGLEAAVAAGDAEAAFRFAESGRGIGFLEMVGARGAEAMAEVPEALREAADLANTRVQEARRVLEARQRARDLRGSREAKQALDEALLAFEVARHQIERLSKLAADAAYPEPAGLAQVQAGLAPADVLVEYGQTGTDLIAIVVRAGAPARIVPLGEGVPIATEGAQLVAALPEPETAPAPEALRDLLVTPLGLGEDVRRLVVVPAPWMSEIPFALLRPDLEVGYAPSATILLRLRSDEPPRGEGVLALGDPDYSGAERVASAAARRGVGLLPLPQTAVEVASIAGTARDARLLAADATEAGLRAALGSGRRWRAVHLACHGLIDAGRPALSSLALTPGGLDDGYLTALEVTSMEVPADLVVLSACETARGRIQTSEGVVGLTRAFMIAGAPAVLCSLWPVDDEATRALMVRFYALWNPPAEAGRAPLAPAAALREAQAAVREDPDHPAWRHPFYWAAWTLWGDPD